MTREKEIDRKKKMEVSEYYLDNMFMFSAMVSRAI